LRPTRRSLLFGIAVVGGSVGWAGALLIDDLGRPLPRVPTSAPTVLLLFAAILFAVALTSRSRLRAWRERRPGARPLDPLTIARYAVLARASSPVGAGVAGLYAGYALFLLPGLGKPGRRHLLEMSLFALFAGLAVGIAALFLERVCRLPGQGTGAGGTMPKPRDRAP